MPLPGEPGSTVDAAAEERTPRHALRVVLISAEARESMHNLSRGTEFKVPVCVASRMTTAWAESLEGSLDGVEAWSHLARYRSRLLLAPIPQGADRNTELKRRLQMWEHGRINDLVAHVAGQQVEAERMG